jgi:hypothetical protein
MGIELNFEFRSDFQEKIFTSTYRHIAGSGGYGNGKTWAFSMRSLLFLCTYSNYRMVIGRQKSTDLAKTTRTTFFNVCPPELYNEAKGGKRADSLNYLRLINGSEVLWMHFDQFDEGTVRGLEINSAFLDQAEEMDENVYLHLDNRIGRWPKAIVPSNLLEQNPNWPIHPGSKEPRVPAWMGIGCNPDVKTHWIYKRYHPESYDWQSKYRQRYVMYEAETDPTLLDPETYSEALSRDPAWIERFLRGKWGIAEGTIHRVLEDSKIYIGERQDSNDRRHYISREFFETLKKKSALYRILDHGENAPTCCAWVAAYRGMHFFFREYYVPNALVSEHRRNITDLSEGEQYQGNYGDPSMHNKTSQKYGGRWSTADEYLDMTTTDAPPIYWQPADNNEFGNRNRINEFLRVDKNAFHPVTNHLGSPRLFFIMKNEEYPNGCHHIPLQTESQKRVQIGTDNGTPVFSDDRDEKIVDHGYDTVRYYFSIHTAGAQDRKPICPESSFEAYRKKAILANRRVTMEDLGFYA